jgi:alpha-beta hydrolase superfamily lysophospholipase
MTFFSSLRFRILITLAKSIIQMRDAAVIATQNFLSRSSQATLQAEIRSGRPLVIPCLNRSLEAVFATPTAPTAAILIFHGIGERLSYWHAAQHLLSESGIASLVFHYSGYGRSTGATTPQNLHQDAHAAYATLLSLLSETTPIYLLGYSLDTGVATEVTPHLVPPPAGLILCQSFTSLRDAAAAIAPAILSPLLPDIWRTHRSIADVGVPLLIVHGDADELFPVAMAQQIASAASRSQHPVSLIHPSGFTHNQAYLRPTLAYWQPIIDFARNSPSPNKTG